MATLSRTRARSRTEAGFSLVELLIALLLLVWILALAGQLLVESGRIHASVARELRETDDRFTLRLLRADLRSGVPAGASSAPWTSEPLALRDGDRAIAWGVEDGRLVRALAQGGEPAVARVQLDRVVALRWRVPFPGLIDVELVRFRGERAPLARVLSAEWRRRGETLEVATLSVAARRSWW